MSPMSEPLGNVADYFFIVKSAVRKTSSKGDFYLDLMLMDAKGEISAKLWDYKETAHGWIEPNMIVKVRGYEEMWNDKKQFRIQRIRHIGPDDEFQMDALVPCAPYDGEQLFGHLALLVRGFTEEPLRQLVLTLITRYKEKMLVCPAAVKLHHAVCGGLLYHTLSVVGLAEGVCSVYPFVNRELLLSGAILHDLAKIDELQVEETGIASGYTKKGILLGHLVMGAMEVEKTGLSLGTPEETVTLLCHMLLSHHGIPEYGCAVRPLFLEAEILSQLDNLDATVNQITASLSNIEKGGFGDKLWSLDQRRFYNHAGAGEAIARIGDLPTRQEPVENTAPEEGE